MGCTVRWLHEFFGLKDFFARLRALGLAIRVWAFNAGSGMVQVPGLGTPTPRSKRWETKSRQVLD